MLRTCQLLEALDIIGVHTNYTGELGVERLEPGQIHKAFIIPFWFPSRIMTTTAPLRFARNPTTPHLYSEYPFGKRPPFLSMGFVRKQQKEEEQKTTGLAAAAKPSAASLPSDLFAPRKIWGSELFTAQPQACGLSGTT